MKNYNRTDYALNKLSENIVNSFVTGIEEITLEDYLAENPDRTAKDFQEIKAISDSIYHEEVVHTHRTTKLNISINCVHSNKLVNDTPIIDEIINAEDTRKIYAATKELLEKGNLTEIQKRRFIKYYFYGLSMREIAREEKLYPSTIMRSIHLADKKIKKIFKNFK